MSDHERLIEGKARPFSGLNGPCPKCTYVANAPVLQWSAVGDLLARACGCCGYAWTETTADKSPSSRLAAPFALSRRALVSIEIVLVDRSASSPALTPLEVSRISLTRLGHVRNCGLVTVKEIAQWLGSHGMFPAADCPSCGGRGSHPYPTGACEACGGTGGRKP